ncbi:MAG TPA: protein kinase [Bryobacteraceae bacterium]|nr:protein kinase [Bryobacteraceae bacterium]
MLTLEPGRIILHYRIVEKIGQGGMGVVYKAEDQKLGRLVAIKALPAAATRDETARLRLVREARSASALNHPNIVTIHSIDDSEDGTFVVMEYVAGETLADLLKRETLAFPRLLDIAVQICDAVGAAHAIGLMHRDIKPQNILITPEGRVKVLDFGLAKPFRHSAEGAQTGFATLSADLTAAGMIAGTVAYMSPEQTRAEALDPRSDVFSIGCVLYEAATGRQAFHGPSTLALMHEIAVTDPPRPSGVRREVPRVFDAIVERAMKKDRELRYATAAHMAEALRGLLSTDYISTGSEGESEVFVGRQPELKRLNEHLRQAVEGAGKVVFLTGEPGMGKTALADEFTRRSRRQHPTLTVARGRCVEQYGTGEAYLPFLDALSELLDGPARNRIVPLLRSHAPTWCLQLPSVFNSSGMIEQLQRDTIGATKERMVREMSDVLGVIAAASPLVLLLEDLHWADSSTVDLLRHVFQRIGGQRLLVLATLRSEDLELTNHPLRKYKLEMQAHKECDEVALRPLQLEHIAGFLDARFVPNDFPPELPELIARKTEGHPLFATALAQFLAERGDIVNTDGRWTLARPLSSMDLEAPESVRSMIRKKIEALAAEDRRILQYASVEGEEFLSTVLAALLEKDELELEEQLAELARAHRMIESHGEEELPDRSLATKYRFAHALYQNLLYDDLVSKRRILLHRQAGERLVQHYRSEAPRIATKLAMHFERGRDFERAIDYLIHAADNATHLYAAAEAERHCTSAIGLVDKLPPEQQAAKSMSLYEKRGSALFALSRFDDAVHDYTHLLDLARDSHAVQLESGALNGLARTLFFSHRLEEMVPRAEEALEAAARAGSLALRLDAMTIISLRRMCYGELSEGRAMLDEMVTMATSIGYKPALAHGLGWGGAARFFQTEYRAAEEHLLKAVELASEMRDGFLLLICHFMLGLTRGNLGRMTEALANLNEGIRIARRNGDLFWFPRLPNCIGWIHRELQDFDKAMEYDREGLEIGRRHNVLEAQANSLINIGIGQTKAGPGPETLAVFGEVDGIFARDAWFRWRYNIRHQAAQCEYWLAAGDLDRAAKYNQNLMDAATKYRVRKYIAVAHMLAAGIAEARKDLETAERGLLEAIEVSKQSSALLVAWKACAALGRLRRQKGAHEAAQTAFAEAATIVRGIAENVDDEALRSKFLNSAAVREVFEGGGLSSGAVV